MIKTYYECHEVITKCSSDDVRNIRNETSIICNECRKYAKGYYFKVLKDNLYKYNLCTVCMPSWCDEKIKELKDDIDDMLAVSSKCKQINTIGEKNDDIG